MATDEYLLQVWEMDPDSAEEAWVTWITYKEPERPSQRCEQLTRKGYHARVHKAGTDPLCPHCGVGHDGPFDGRCLI